MNESIARAKSNAKILVMTLSVDDDFLPQFASEVPSGVDQSIIIRRGFPINFES